jgi:hypothetical protein
MKAFLSDAIDVMFMGMELRTANFPSRVRCGDPWMLVMALGQVVWFWGPGSLGVLIRWLHRLMTLAGTVGDTLIHLQVLLRSIGNWLTQRFKSLHCWLVQGLYWCRVSNSSLFLWLLHLLLNCCFIGHCGVGCFFFGGFFLALPPASS